jgi:general bacterial porin, GBP family
MKKNLIVMAALGSAACIGQAQSTHTTYGKVDLGVIKLSGDVTGLQKTIKMQQNHISRLGFKGIEDLGDGLSALFQIETRFNPDTGTQQNGTALFNGPVVMGLAGGFGTMKLGRNWSTLGNADSVAIDPFEGDGIGGLNALTAPRVNNSITYYSPDMSGFGVEVQYILGEKPATIAAEKQNNGYTVAASYNKGPIHLGAGYGREENTNQSVDWGVSGSYAFGPAKILLGYDHRENKEAANMPKTTNFVLGATYEIGAGLIKVAYNQTNNGADNTITNAGIHDKFQKVAIEYQHNLSKRTSLYADVARTKVADPGISNSVTGVGVGITHSF